MSFDLIRGVQLDPRTLKVVEHFVGYFASMGVNTVLPFTIRGTPIKKAAVTIVVGVTGQGGYMQTQGIEWDIDLTTRQITWLSTARQALDDTKWLSVTYWPYGDGSVNALSWRLS